MTSPASAPSASAPFASAPSVSFPAKPVTRPNIVFVLTDDLSMNLVQYMPHMLALEHAGTSFSNYSVTDSLCCPSRSSIFSGKFPHDTRVFTNTGADGGFNVFHSRGEESATFATALQKVGYRTAMMGKYLNGYQPADALGGSQPYVPPGWNEWDVAGNGYPEFNYDLNQDHKVVHHGKTPGDYLTDVVSGKGSSFVAASAAAHSPFLLEIATFAPHTPSTPAPQDANAFPGLKAPRGPAFNTLPASAPAWLASRSPLTGKETAKINKAFRKRVQSVQAVDRMIGSLEATLAKARVAGSTDIVFSSDNGYHMGEYRLTPGKMTAFDTDVNVPLVAAGPGIPAGKVVGTRCRTSTWPRPSKPSAVQQLRSLSTATAWSRSSRDNRMPAGAPHLWSNTTVRIRTAPIRTIPRRTVATRPRTRRCAPSVTPMSSTRAERRSTTTAPSTRPSCTTSPAPSRPQR